MWLVDPKLMCRKHLLGEHVEIHMLTGCLLRGKNINGFLKGLVNPALIETRHEELVKEIQARGYLHKSPLPDLAGIARPPCWHVNKALNLAELNHRCPGCNQRMHHMFDGKE